MRIGLISDIHGWLRPEVFELFDGVDHILFAGDVERPELLDDLEAIAPLDAVWGNVDGAGVRSRTSESVEVDLAGVRFAVSHGHRVAPRFEELLRAYPTADVVVHGHSHVPRRDRFGTRWLVNPGAASEGRHGRPASVAVAELDAGSVRITHLALPDGEPFSP